MKTSYRSRLHRVFFNPRVELSPVNRTEISAWHENFQLGAEFDPGLKFQPSKLELKGKDKLGLKGIVVEFKFIRQFSWTQTSHLQALQPKESPIDLKIKGNHSRTIFKAIFSRAHQTCYMTLIFKV